MENTANTTDALFNEPTPIRLGYIMGHLNNCGDGIETDSEYGEAVSGEAESVFRQEMEALPSMQSGQSGQSGQIAPRTLADLQKQQAELQDAWRETRDWFNMKLDDFRDDPTPETKGDLFAAINSYHGAAAELSRNKSEIAAITCLNLTEAEARDLCRHIYTVYPTVYPSIAAERQEEASLP